MIGIVDYGMGNLLSVFHAVEMVGEEPKIIQDPRDLRNVDRIILPGVGAFRDCVQNLRRLGFVEALEEEVLSKKKPILGICLGMQAMAERGFEHGEWEGLGWFPGDVVRLRPSDSSLRVPQIGWNEISYRKGSSLFKGLPERPAFYFVHSYEMKCTDPSAVAATAEYGGPVTAAVQRGNIAATQFHPEKSQDYGLKLLENFAKWTGEP